MKYTFLLICLTLIIVTGCTDNILQKGYITHPKSISTKKIKITASLVADPAKNDLILYMNVLNNSKKIVRVDYTNCYLGIETDRVAIAEFRKSFKETLSPGDSEDYELRYTPINSPEFLKKANYSGDMKQKYSLKVDFIKDEKGTALSEKTFIFEMQDSAYKNYLRDLGIENKIQFYSYSFNKDSFISGQKKYIEAIVSMQDQMTDSNKDKPFDYYVMVSNSEIIIDNRVLNIISNRQEDTLCMKIWIVNMGTEKLKVLLNKFGVSDEDHTYYPFQMLSEFFNYSQVIDSSSILNQGARFNLLLRYVIPGKISQYKLNMDWLLIQNTDEIKKDDYRRLIYRDLTFN